MEDNSRYWWLKSSQTWVDTSDVWGLLGSHSLAWTTSAAYDASQAWTDQTGSTAIEFNAMTGDNCNRFHMGHGYGNCYGPHPTAADDSCIASPQGGGKLTDQTTLRCFSYGHYCACSHGNIHGASVFLFQGP